MPEILKKKRRIRALRKLEQQDLSNSVVHFTGRVGKANPNVPENILALDGRSRLAAVLQSRQLNAYSVFFSCGDPVVCFSEATLEGMRTLVKSGRYQSWGLEFPKDFVFQAGGGPSLYVRGDHWDAFAASDLPLRVKAFGTKYWPGTDLEFAPGIWLKTGSDIENEWAHEREWRVPIALEEQLCAMRFEYRDIVSIIAPSTAEGDALKKSLGAQVQAEIANLSITPLAEPSAALKPKEVVIALVLLNYDQSVDLFKRMNKVVAGYPGAAPVVLELPRSGGGDRRITTSFRVTPSHELRTAIQKEAGDLVTRIDLP